MFSRLISKEIFYVSFYYKNREEVLSPPLVSRSHGNPSHEQTQSSSFRILQESFYAVICDLCFGRGGGGGSMFVGCLDFCNFVPNGSLY